MINIKRIDQDTPIKKRFEMLTNGSMFIDPEEELELMIKVNDYYAIEIASGETFGYEPNCEIILCDVNIEYSIKFK